MPCRRSRCRVAAHDALSLTNSNPEGQSAEVVARACAPETCWRGGLALSAEYGWNPCSCEATRIDAGGTTPPPAAAVGALDRSFFTAPSDLATAVVRFGGDGSMRLSSIAPGCNNVRGYSKTHTTQSIGTEFVVTLSLIWAQQRKWTTFTGQQAAESECVRAGGEPPQADAERSVRRVVSCRGQQHDLNRSHIGPRS
jgi:hypothetical protein